MEGDENHVIVGCGYTGERLAIDLRNDGERVLALVRSPESAERIGAHGLTVLRWDLDADGDAPRMPPNALICYLTPPPRDGEDDPRLARFLSALDVPPIKIVYLSTSGVYGDRGGAAVDEEAEPSPHTGRARRRLAAERRLIDWCERCGSAWIILRVPAIYGPGRLPLAMLRAGEPLLHPDDAGPGNRIQVDDLVTVCRAALASDLTHEIINVGDGNTASSTDYFLRVAQQAGIASPPLLRRDAFRQSVSPGRWSFVRESRLLDTRKMVRFLRPELKYRDLDEGIAASLVPD